MSHPARGVERSGLPAWAIGLGVVVCLGVLLYAALGWRQKPAPVRPTAPPPAAGASPYLNVVATVRYVGDGACATCHPKHAETYRRHPMGRSATTIAEFAPGQEY